MHGVHYAAEHGFDPTFEAYVAEPLARFAIADAPRERLWIVERDRALVGCIAIVAASEHVAQLRWFLVTPDARGIGLGKRLLGDAIDFAALSDYRSIVLWTVSRLEAAGHLYRSFGFQKVEAVHQVRWGRDVIEERYERALREPLDDTRGPS